MAEAPTSDVAAGDDEGPERRAIEAERDELLATLARLDEDAAAGDLDGEEADAVRDDLTLRLAAVLRRLDGGSVEATRRTGGATASDAGAATPLWRRKACCDGLG